ncbi:MAG: hypothetical protein HZA24_09850 [Nitrospirae bacterium]|nr:hypothetical protein [Nitrospirota bacterium]
MAALPLFAAALLVAGCATWSAHGVGGTGVERLEVAVLPVRPTAHVRHLADIADAPAPDGADERALIDAELAAAAAHLDGVLHPLLADQPELAPVSPDRVRAALPEAPPDDAGAAAIGRRLGVPAVLRTELSGYGRLKGRWVAILIGTGVVEGVAQGIVAVRLTDNRWLGLGLLLEEIAQEVLTWGGGAYLFNAHYAPVTLEVRLIASADGHAIWHDTILVGINRKALKVLPEAERKRRSVQLRVTAERAAGHLAGALGKAARRHL